MKICFNIFPPANKLIALLLCLLLILSYTRSKAANDTNNINRSIFVYKQQIDQQKK